MIILSYYYVCVVSMTENYYWRKMKKLQLKSKGFLKNYTSKLTLITAILAVMAGLLPTYYMEYGSSATRLQFACIYGILFILIILVGARWLYWIGHPQGTGEKPKGKVILLTIFNALLSWAGIGLVEWGIQRIYQSQIWDQFSDTSYLYLHRASLINIIVYPIIAACFLFPILLACCNLGEYWKRFLILFLRAYPLLLLVGAGISLIQIYFKNTDSLQSLYIAILGTFLLWSITVTEYVTIYQKK